MVFTSIDDEGEATVSTNFPVGSGEIHIYKDGYAQYADRFGTLLHKGAAYDIDMVPERFMDGRIKTKRMAFLPGTGGTYGMINPGDIEAEGSVVGDRIAVLRLTRIDDDPYKGYQSVIAFDPMKEQTTSFLTIPGKYEVEGELIKRDGIVLEASSYTYNVPFGEDETIEFNRTEIENWIEGGIILNNGSYIEIPADALLNNMTGLFFILQFPIPVLQDRMMGDAPDLSQATKHEEYSAQYVEYLQPRYI